MNHKRSYELSIPLIIKEHDGHNYTGYLLLVSDGLFQWEVEVRYSACFELHETLKKVFDDLPPFPGKKFQFFASSGWLEERKDQLEFYFQNLPKEAFRNAHLIAFLGIHNPATKRRPCNIDPDFMIEQYLIDSFLLVEDMYPVFYLSDGKEFYLRVLFHTITDNITKLQRIKNDLDTIYGFQERMDFLHINEHIKIHIVNELLSVKDSITTILSDGVSEESLLYKSLDQSLSIVDRALNWSNSIEMKITEEISEAFVNTNQLIQGYRIEGDSYVSLYLQLPEEMNFQAIEQLDALITQLDDEMVIFQEDESCVQSLKSMKDYFSNILNQMKNGTLYAMEAESTIEDLQTRMFCLLDELNELTKEATNDELLQSKKTIDKLIIDLGKARNQMEKSIENEQERNIMISRVEDLQQNMADIEHRFKEKQDYYDQTLLAKRREKEQADHLNKVRTRHERKEQDFFEL
eukprot:TRINITY_DN5536_c0_g1_i1.p1 TRINITY_DN5536_c0_g1~~TRINITY_DN5536_c0_g1_i1.p1  ORF type:complete len:463 (+),score=107.24 TRINITY_DN5536_c0_g1_i1:50-1438(+)